MVVRAKLREVAERASFDPKQALIESLGSIDAIEVFHNLVLVATYIEPDKTPGGIIKPDRTLAENRFQGKCALVLKCGPQAFQDDSVQKFGGVKVEAGDWVIVRPSDGFELFKVDGGASTGTCCRLFNDVNIMGRVSDPALIY
jgi:co-chaperonin GroES (HSP10)